MKAAELNQSLRCLRLLVTVRAQPPSLEFLLDPRNYKPRMKDLLRQQRAAKQFMRLRRSR